MMGEKYNKRTGMCLFTNGHTYAADFFYCKEGQVGSYTVQDGLEYAI